MATQNPSSAQFEDFGQTNSTGTYTPVTILGDEDRLALKPLSQVELYWRRFRKHRFAQIGSGFMVFVILMAIAAPLITPGVNASTMNLNLSFGSHPPSLSNFPDYIFGTTDELHYSVLDLITFGARTSLIIGFFSALLSVIVGTLVGAVAGYFGGIVDNIIMRITDIFLTIPFFPLLISLSSILGHGSGLGPGFIITIFAIFGWAGISRVIRSVFLSLRELEYTEAAKSVGINHFRIIVRHLIPNAISPIVVTFTLAFAANIVAESTLDFLGLGIMFPPTATWGNALASAQGDIANGDWWWTLFPGLFLTLTVLATSFIGDGLRDALDVRSKID